MPRSHHIRAGLMAVAVAVVLAAPVAARILVPAGQSDQQLGGVTVVLADGWEFAGVTAYWFADAGLLVAERPDGARRTFRPEDLAGLRDAGGRDITASILPAWAVARLGGTMPPPGPAIEPGPVPEPDPGTGPDAVTEPGPMVGPRPPAEPGRGAEPDLVPPRRPARPPGRRTIPPPGTGDPALVLGDPGVVFGLEMGYAEPHDQHFANYEGGFGFEATLRMQFVGPFYLMGGYLYQTLQSPPRLQALAPHDVVGGPSYHLGEYGRISGPWLGLSLVSTADAPRPVRFYMEAGIGQFEVEEMPVQSAEDAYLGYRFGTGFLFPMGDYAALDLGVRGLHVENLDFGWSAERDHTMIGLRAGISLLGF